jgi:hypothetical protein
MDSDACEVVDSDACATVEERPFKGRVSRANSSGALAPVEIAEYEIYD